MTDDASTDAPQLTPEELKEIDRLAKEAGDQARLQKALELMPFDELMPNQRLVAAWLSTLTKKANPKLQKDQDLAAFWHAWINNSEPPYTMESIQVQKSLSPRNTLNPKTVQTWDDFCRALALTFCSYSDTDEIHELMTLSWRLTVTSTYSPIGGVDTQQRVFTHEKTSLTKALALTPVLPGGKKQAGQYEQMVVAVARAHGHQVALENAYREAYDARRKECEEEIMLDEARNAEVQKANEKRDKRRALGSAALAALTRLKNSRR